MQALANRVVRPHWAAHKLFKRGYFIQSHHHPFWQTVYVKQGRLVVSLGDNPVPLASNQCCIIKPGERHSLFADDDTRVLEAKFFLSRSCGLHEKLQQVSSLDELPASAPMLLLHLVNEAEQKRAHHYEMVELLLEQFLLLLVRHIDNDQPPAEHPGDFLTVLKDTAPRDSKHQKVLTILEYMKDHLDEDISLTQLADRFNYNPTYLCEMFTKTIEMSPMECLTTMRLQRAQEMLVSSSASITRIAMNVGYNSVQHFSRMFKKQTGISPSTYRSQHSTNREVYLFAEGYSVSCIHRRDDHTHLSFNSHHHGYDMDSRAVPCKHWN